MKVVGVIPARFASTRFPGKPLHKILNKPLLQWVIEGAKTSREIGSLLVATDSVEIANLAEQCGVMAVMTDSSLPSGSDRVWAAVQNIDADIIINIQGDEPLVQGEILDQLVKPFYEINNLEMSTLARPLDTESLISPNTAKIVLDSQNYAIYFSRCPIPYTRESLEAFPRAALKHLGVYAYKKSFLERFCSCPVTVIENCEGLEQLRALYLGAKIKVVETNYESWGVDTPGDVNKVEGIILREQKKTGKT